MQSEYLVESFNFVFKLDKPKVMIPQMDLVQYRVEDRIAYISLNRPEKRNAFNAKLVEELKAIFTYAEKDTNAKVIVLRANGQVFSAGADLGYLKSLQAFSYEENLADSQNLRSLFQQIYQLDKVVIGQVEGHAIAGGCGLSTVCDIVFAVPEAKFGYTEARIGFVAAMVMVFLVRKLGEAKVKELLLTGKLISAKEAEAIGLINQTVAKEEIAEAVKKFASKMISSCAESSLRLTKQMIDQVQSMSLDEGLDYGAKINATARGSEDCKKGMAAFLNKEKIVW